MHHKSKFLLLFILLIAYNPLNSQISESVSSKVDSIVRDKMKSYMIPGLAIGVIQADKTVISKGYGVKNIDNSSSVDEKTTFHTASVSKLFTAMAVVQLFEDQKISLDLTLAKLLPNLQYANEKARQMTIRQLLNHSSGLPDIRNYHWKNHHSSDSRLEEYVSGLALKPNYKPGTEYRYSNLGYNILAYVVQFRSGVLFEEYVASNILSAAGMENSDFRYFKTPGNNRASPHTMKRTGSQIFVREIYPYSREHAGSSTLNASVNDLNQWMIYFLEALKKGNYKNMIVPSLDFYDHIGLGFQLGEVGDYVKAGHYGGDHGFRSYLFLIPEKELGFVLLTNCDYNEDFRQEILHPIAELLITQTVEPKSQKE